MKQLLTCFNRAHVSRDMLILTGIFGAFIALSLLVCIADAFGLVHKAMAIIILGWTTYIAWHVLPLFKCVVVGQEHVSVIWLNGKSTEYAIPDTIKKISSDEESIWVDLDNGRKRVRLSSRCFEERELFVRWLKGVATKPPDAPCSPNR